MDLTVIDLEHEREVRCLYAYSDSIFIVGGDFNRSGFIGVLPNSAAQYIPIRDGLKRELYSIIQHRERWYVGGDSLLLYRGKHLSTMDQYFFQQDDWVSDLSNHPIRAIAQDSQSIAIAAGGRLAFGVAYLSFDDAGSWSTYEPENEIRTVVRTEEYTWMGGNGILIKAQRGSAEWERVALDDRFIVDMVIEGEEGWLLSIEGEIVHMTDGAEITTIHEKKLPTMHSLAKSGSYLIAVGEEGTVLYSTDEGATWRSERIEGYGALNDVLINDDVLYMGTSVGKILSFPLDALKG